MNGFNPNLICVPSTRNPSTRNPSTKHSSTKHSANKHLSTNNRPTNKPSPLVSTSRNYLAKPSEPLQQGKPFIYIEVANEMLNKKMIQNPM